MADVDELVSQSAAPAAVSVALDRIREAHGPLEDAGLLAALVAVSGASRALTELVVSDADALETLRDLGVRPPCPRGDAEAARAWKRRELLRIAARDLLGLDPLEVVGAALATMAGDVLRAAADGAALAVIGMGKMGGAELNYASDVDVLFVGGSEEDAHGVLDFARRSFRVDADLRPEGRSGALTRSLDSYEAYWDRWAQTWEFQALIKARPVAGATELGRAFLAAASQRVWERPFTAEDLRSVRSMKARAEGEVKKKGLTTREVKRGWGGIRDIEFAVQLLQLVHGRHDRGLRSPTTLDALAELSGAGYVDPSDAGALEDAYRFLRAVEHRLQLVDEQQTHSIPNDEAARTRLARVLGYRDTADETAVDQLDEQLRRHQATVRSIHERLFFRPLLECFGPEPGRMSLRAAEERLAAFGFADAERTRQALRELTRGLTRSSRLMQQLLPVLLEWLSDAPDPDLGLLALRNLVSRPTQATELTIAFRDSPEVARRLCLLTGTSRILGDTLQHNPDLIPMLDDDDALLPRDRAGVLGSVEQTLGWRDEGGDRAPPLLRLRQREELRIAASDILNLTGVEETGAALTALAEGVVEAALHAVEPPVPFAVIAMGRFGGGELSFASDLDVLFVYDGTSDTDFAAADRTASRLLRFVNGTHPANRIYELDADLRPEGKQGPLARSLDGYRTYYERWAQTWEQQALVRARPVAGDAALGQRFLDLIAPFVWRDELPADAVREIRRMKARVERERIPAGEDPQFHLKLGRGSLSDVEWTAQLLQLQHRIPAPGTMAAILALQKAGVLAAEDAGVLAEAYRFCERTRNRWFLVKGARGDSLPTQPDQLARLARSLDTRAGDLREHYRRVTRRSRTVVERVFYGREA